MGRHRLVSAGALPLILLLAACSGGGGATTAPSTAANPSTAASPSSAASPGGSATAGGAIDLKVAAGSGSVTNYLTGADGKTLYIFKKDTADSGKSACAPGPCLTNWPPLTVSAVGDVKVDAAVTGKVDVITRDDGTKQVTYKGLPLYYFAADKKAGDTNGATIDNWAVANP